MKYLTETEQRRLLKTAGEIKGRQAERDFMLLTLGFYTGLRRAELAGLNVGDVRGRDRLTVRPETAKRAKSRTIPLSKKLQGKIKRFLRLKLSWGEGIQDEAPLFISKKGRRLSQRAINDLCDYWAGLAGVPEFTPHSMRHSFAKRLLQRGYLLTHVQKLLGHSSLASTGIYAEVDYEDLQDAVEAL